MAGLRVVRMGRSVRVDSEDLETWIGRKGEIGGARERAKRSMFISAPPYKHDPTRRHVSILLEHPRTHVQLPRKRLVTPFACDEEGGRAWGLQQALDWLEKLMGGESEDHPTNETRAKPREPTPLSLTPSITMKELWERYQPIHYARLRPGTAITGEIRYRTRIAPVLGSLPIGSIGKEEVLRLRDSLSTYDAHFANQVLGDTRRMLQWATDRNLIAMCPEIRSEKRTKKPALVVPDEEDLESLLVAAAKMMDGERYQGTDLVLIILLGLDAGLRPGETAGLRWCDVDLGKNRIIVRNSRSRRGDSDMPPKAGDAGTVYLTERLHARLAQRQRETKGRGRGYVFVSTSGKPLCTVTVSKRVRDVHEYAGLESKGAHWLRHCAASRILNGGGTLENAKDHLRHSDLTVTQRYVHSVFGSDPGPVAANVLDRRIAGHGKTMVPDGN